MVFEFQRIIATGHLAFCDCNYFIYGNLSNYLTSLKLCIYNLVLDIFFLQVNCRKEIIYYYSWTNYFNFYLNSSWRCFTWFCSGIGLALAERLITIHPNIHLCLACRSKSKAQTAQKMLLALSPTASVSFLLVDLSSLASIYSVAEELRSRSVLLVLGQFN